MSARKTDTGIQTNGNKAERLLTYIANAPRLKGGDLAICAEYGRVEIMDSDDGQVRLRIRRSSSGEGAAKALADTDARARLTADNGLLRVAVWHATQGFAQQMQPLREAEALLCDRHRPNAFARRREDRIANCWKNRRQCRLAQASRRIVRFQEMHFDGRRLGHS